MECEVSVRLQPRARATEIVGERDGVLLVRVSAPPIEGRANDALCRLIAKRAHVGVRSVSIARGSGAREKVVRVEGIDLQRLREALGASQSTRSSCTARAGTVARDSSPRLGERPHR